jgi:hypothetical protein
MHRKFIALIISTAVAVTALSAPARADSDDIARALFGIAALALIGKALSDDDSNHQTAPQPIYRPVPQPVRPRPLPPVVSRYDLPGYCLRSYQVNRDRIRLFGAGCLSRNYRYSASLPYACQFQFSEHGRSYTGYEPLCLRERGYRIARK